MKLSSMAGGLVLLCGCFLSHERGDAGPVEECTPPPAISCPEVRAIASCIDASAVVAGRPFRLPVTFGVAGCCPARACLASVDDAARVIRLTTSLCSDDVRCETPRLVVAECDVAGLREGIYQVEANGHHAFALPVVASPPEPAACASFGGPYCEPSGRLFTEPYSPDDVCVTTSEGSTFVVARTMCWMSHWADGPCLAVLDGDVLDVTPQRFDASCLDHPECGVHDVRCLVPPLTPGVRYRLRVAGESSVTFVAGEEDSSDCSGG